MERLTAAAMASALGLGLASCGEAPEGTESEPEVVETTPTSTPTPTPTSDPEAEAKAQKAEDELAIRKFIDLVYGRYASDTAPGFADNAGSLYEPKLAAMLTRMNREMNESDVLYDIMMADPICGCQDFGPFSHTIKSVTVNGDRAEAELTVRNMGTSHERSIQLVKTSDGWRIYDLDGNFRKAVEEDKPITM